jgi:Importin repeat
LVNESFNLLVKNIFDSLIYSLNHDEKSGLQVLETLNTLTDVNSKIWQSHIESIVSVICEIAKQKTFESNTRESAVEILLTIANRSPAFLRKSENFKTQFLPLVFELLLEIDNLNDLEKWNKEVNYF